MLVGWFYDMSILVRIFNTKVVPFLFVCWYVGFMICQLLLGYLIPKSSFFVRVLVRWFYGMSILVKIFNTKVFFIVFVLVGFMICQFLLGYLIPKFSFFVCVLVGWFCYMSTLVRIFSTKVFIFCLCVGW